MIFLKKFTLKKSPQNQGFPKENINDFLKEFTKKKISSKSWISYQNPHPNQGFSKGNQFIFCYHNQMNKKFSKYKLIFARWDLLFGHNTQVQYQPMLSVDVSDIP